MILPLCFPFLISCGKKQNGTNSIELSFLEETVFLGVDEECDFKIQCNKEAPQINYEYNKSIIFYDGNMIKGVGEGYTELKASIDNVSCSCNVYVTLDDIELRISDEELNLDVGEEENISLIYKQSTYPYVYWMSENEDIASVNDDGYVLGVAPGTTNIIGYSHGETYVCKVDVFGVDNSIDDWFIGDESIYGQGFGQKDVSHPERYYLAWGRLKREGIYLAGYCYHSTYSDSLTYWWGNTNFEVKLLVGSNIVTYFASENIICPDATTYMKTTINNQSTSDYDKYYSQFEIFIPYDSYFEMQRISFAFKTEGEKMSFVVGGDSPTIIEDDWWWIDLHYPTNADEMFYLYADGLYEVPKP